MLNYQGEFHLRLYSNMHTNKQKHGHKQKMKKDWIEFMLCDDLFPPFAFHCLHN
jgi:hypothetical protein